jgi:SAM-dependent methyltransferase
MSDRASCPPTGRFSGVADLYARWRPDYPAAAVDLIVKRCGLDGSAPLADVGCGTGISTRQFAARGVPVIGVEPNDAMRAKAEAAPPPPGAPPPRYVRGTAEATGLADGSVRAVLSAQAFHWFDAEAALREFRRVLQPVGWVALLWNERDESDPFTAAYGDVVRTSPEAAAVEGPRAQAGEPLLRTPLFADAQRIDFRHEQALDEEGLLGRSFSASYAPREPAAVEAFADALRRLFAQHQTEGKVRVVYQTSVYLAHKP